MPRSLKFCENALMLNSHPTTPGTSGNAARCSEFENESHSGFHTLGCNPLLNSDLIVCDWWPLDQKGCYVLYP